MAADRLYVVIKPDRRDIISSPFVPALYRGSLSLVGPFHTRAGATIARDNPLVFTVDEAEKLAAAGLQ